MSDKVKQTLEELNWLELEIARSQTLSEGDKPEFRRHIVKAITLLSEPDRTVVSREAIIEVLHPFCHDGDIDEAASLVHALQLPAPPKDQS